MVTTVTDNSPQSINTSLFSLDKEVQEVKKTTDALNDKLSGINTESGVISVNGKQGIVELNASDVDALPSSTVIPTTTSELENNSGFITINDVGSSFVPVTRKVNNKQLNTDITLTASDVGALPNTTVIPTKTSELTNNSGFITSSDSITGNAATATTADKATKDASGNVITSTYLPLSGGAMTGNISYQGSKSTDEMIKFIDNKNDAWGNGVAIGGGGATIIGGGESSNVLKDTLTSGGNELMKIGNDDIVEIWTNLQYGIASGKKFTFGVDGNITTPLGTVALKSDIGEDLYYEDYRFDNPSWEPIGNVYYASMLKTWTGDIRDKIISAQVVYWTGFHPWAILDHAIPESTKTTLALFSANNAQGYCIVRVWYKR